MKLISRCNQKKYIALFLSVIFLGIMLTSFNNVLAADIVYPTVTKVEADSETVSVGDTFSIFVYANDESGINVKNSGILLTRKRVEGETDKNRSAGFSPTSEPGKYEVKFTVTEDWVAGEYTITVLTVADNNDNNGYFYSYSQVDGKEVLPKVVFTVETPPKDIVYPTVTKVEANSETVTAGDTFSIFVYANDESGINVKNSGILLTRKRVEGETDKNRSAGFSPTSEPGKYEVKFTVTEDWAVGEYTITVLTVADNNDNNGYFYSYSQVDGKEVLPKVVFTVETPPKDIVYPTVTKVEANSETVTAGDTFSIFVYANDESGINVKNSGILLTRKRVEGETDKNRSAGFSPTSEPGKYEVKFTVTEDWAAGEYTITVLTVADNNDNNGYFYSYSQVDGKEVLPKVVFTVRIDEPSTKEEEPSTKQEEPSTKQEEPSTKQEEPSTKQEEPSTKQEEPSTKQEEPSTKQEEPTTKKEADLAIPNGIEKGHDGKWAMYKNGKVDTSVTGVYQNKYGWWRVENGYVNFNAQGIYQNSYGWWKCTDGKVTFKETGIFQNQFGWWRVKDSKVDFNAQSIYQNKFGWWKTTNGKVTFKENGLFKNQYGTWKVENSKVNFNYNGTYQGKMIKNGKVQ